MSLRLLCTLLLALGVVACGDDGGATDSSVDTGAGDPGGDTGASDATADAGCEGAMEGGACTMDGTFCGGPCADVCSFCNLLECRDGMWGRVEAAPAPCFACGPEVRCQADVEYCLALASGVPGGMDTYRCIEPPKRCLAGVTCECLTMAGVVGDCSEPSPGEVTMSVAAP